MLTRALEEDDFDSIIDPRLQNDYDPNEMARMVACAAACTRHSAKRRPRMSQVNQSTFVVIFHVINMLRSYIGQCIMSCIFFVTHRMKNLELA